MLGPAVLSPAVLLQSADTGARPYLVQGRHGRGAHHQRYADDRVAVEAICVRHHHDASDGEDGGHDLDRRKTEVRVEVGAGRASEVETLTSVQHREGACGLLFSLFGEQEAKAAPA